MPPMHKVDDYDDCFLKIPDGAKATYCMVTSLIKPNDSSPIWQIVHVSAMISFEFRRTLRKTVSGCRPHLRSVETLGMLQVKEKKSKRQIGSILHEL